MATYDVVIELYDPFEMLREKKGQLKAFKENDKVEPIMLSFQL
jgi:hypothetical protein